MKTLIITIVLTFSMTYLTGQNAVLDSLQQALESNIQKDTVRVRLLIQVSNNVVWNSTQKAMTLAVEALQIAEDIKWQRGIAYAYRQKGVVFYWMSDYLNALEMNQKALKAADKLNDEPFVSGIYNNLANIYSDLEQYEKALDYYDKLLEISKKNNGGAGEVIARVNRALVYGDLGRHQDALSDLRKGLNISIKLNHIPFQSAILNNLGRAYEKIQNTDSAIVYYKKAIALAQQTDNRTTVTSSTNRLANIYLQSNDIEQAEVYALQALEAAEGLNALEGQSDALKTLSKTYEYKEDYVQSLSAFKKHVILRDSILNEENKSEITRKEMQFKMEMNDALSSAEITKQTTFKNLAISATILIALLSVAGYLLYKKRRDDVEQKKEADFKLKVAENELKVLRSQMNPHFIFNSLNSISDYMDKNDVDTANDYLIKFSRLMRLTLEHSEKEMITLSEDLEWMKLYLGLEGRRLGGQLSYQIEIDDQIDSDNINVPPMILQPFVENSIWHGIAGKTGKGEIKITISRDNDMLICAVDDDGVGLEKSEKSIHNSFGVKITQNRIDIINTMKGTSGNVQLQNHKEGPGVQVQVKLPLELVY